jgi:hypothetical protein
MPDDLTPKVVQALDDTEMKAGGGARATTRIRFMLGSHGPFEHIFDRNPTKFDIEQVMRARREQLEGLV